MFTDYIANGRPHGEFAQGLARFGYDDGMYRPYYNSKGVACVTVNTGRVIEKDGQLHPEREVRRIADLMRAGKMNPTWNATSMRHADWAYIEKRLQLATRQPLRAWADLSASSSISGFDALSKMTYEYEAMSDPGEVMVSMDGRAFGRNSPPEFVTSAVPLPILHVDCSMGLREELVSRNSGMSLKTGQIEAAGRRIAEKVEDMVIGLTTGPAWGTRSGYFPHREASTVQGYLNFAQRQIKNDLTQPTGNNPDDTVDDILEMRDLMYDSGFAGPFMLYHSTDWNQYMDADYGKIGTGSSYGFAPTKTLRQRIREIEDIQDVRQLRRLTSAGGNPFTLILVNMSPETADAINGATPRTVQWETKGGWELNIRVWAIQVPVLKYDYNGNAGVVVGTVP